MFYEDYEQRLKRPDFALPERKMDGLMLLDVGCGNGWAMAHPHFAQAQKYGIDVDKAMIADGRAKFPGVWLTYGSAESIPYGPDMYDVVMSRVALPYTDIRASLAEIHRVLKPGGDMFLTMHDWRHWALFFRGAIRLRAFRSLIDHVYVVASSAVFNLTGSVPRRPWNDTRESFQTERRMRKELERTGFIDIEFSRTQNHWRISARKADA